VENAIKHGVADSVEGGTIVLAAQKNNSRLFITVENPIEADVPEKKGAGMGIDIVRKRLQAVYGSDGDVKTSVSNAVFQVIIFLPSSIRK
jgi:LytS/YehU family sensor histidine kinase